MSRSVVIPGSDGGGIYRSRIYLVGQTHYQVMTVSSTSKEKPKVTSSFLDSFKFKRDEGKAKKSGE